MLNELEKVADGVLFGSFFYKTSLVASSDLAGNERAKDRLRELIIFIYFLSAHKFKKVSRLLFEGHLLPTASVCFFLFLAFCST